MSFFTSFRRFALTAHLALLAVAASVHAAQGDVEVNVDAATDGISSFTQTLLAGGVIEIGWLNPGTTQEQIQALAAASDFAGIDAVFNQVVVVPFPAGVDFDSGGGQYFKNVIVVTNGDAVGLAAYKNAATGAAGKDWYSWVRNDVSLAATTQMAFIDGVGKFPTANDLIGFTDFAGTFAHSVPPAGTVAWVGTIATVMVNSQIDNLGAGNTAGDGLGATGSGNVLQLAALATTATISFEAGSATVAEDAGTVTLTVLRTGKMDNTVSIQYSTMEISAAAGTDFVPVTNQMLNFGPNVTSLPVPITINDRPGFQQSRTFKVTLSNPNPPAEVTLGTTEVTVTITDSDPAMVGTIQFKNAPYSVNENQGSVTIIVSRVGGTDGLVSAQLSSQDISATSVLGPNQDYSAVSQTIMFANGNSTDQMIQIPVVDDAVFEGDERFQVSLSNPTGDPMINIPPTLGASAEVTIVDNEVAPPAGTIRFTSSSFSGSEALGNAGIPITVTRTGGAGAAAIQIVLTAGTASTPADFGTPNPSTLNWADGETGDKSFVVPVVDNNRDEPAKTFNASFNITAGNAVAVDPSTVTVTIDDDDTAGTFGFMPATVADSENAGNVTLTIARTGGSDGAATILVTTGGGSAVPGTDYTALTNQPVSFADGQLTATVNVAIIDNDMFGSDKTFDATLTTSTSGAMIDPVTGTAMVTITENDAPSPGNFSFSRSKYSVEEAAGTRTIDVMRTGGSDVAASVEYRVRPGTAGSADFTEAVGILDFAIGETSKTFDVEIANDALLETDETINLRLANPTNGAGLGAIPTAKLTILNDDEATTFSFSAKEYPTTEGETVSLLVNRVGGLDQTQSVNWFVINGTAINRVDFTAPGGTLVFEPNETQKTIAIKIRDDEFPEPEETFTVALSKVDANDPSILLVRPSRAQVIIARSDATEQPDVIISREEERFVGDDFYTTTGDGQISIKTVRSGRSATFTIRVQNDGTAIDSFILKGTTSGTASSGSVAVIRKVNGVDVTDRILSDDGIKFNDVAPRQYQVLQITVRAVRGQQFSGFAFNLTVTSEADPTAIDAARVGVLIR